MRAAVVLALTCLAAPMAAGLQITFTGDVVADFPSGPGVFIANDAPGDVAFPHDGVLDPTGWDIRDVRFAYDSGTDTAYFGEWVLPSLEVQAPRSPLFLTSTHPPVYDPPLVSPSPGPKPHPCTSLCLLYIEVSSLLCVHGCAKRACSPSAGQPPCGGWPRGGWPSPLHTLLTPPPTPCCPLAFQASTRACASRATLTAMATQAPRAQP
jgi:hypothetical protein